MLSVKGIVFLKIKNLPEFAAHNDRLFKINMAKLVIPYNNYNIDSAKFYIDADVFSRISIPNNFLLIDNDTGLVLNEFKKNSLEIPYKNHKIYLALVTKQLRQVEYKKILIYFCAKISDDYFSGITMQDVFNVLEHIQSLGYLEFGKSTNEVFKAIYVKDLDIKMDIKLSYSDLDKIKEYNKSLAHRFNGTKDNFHLFNNQKQGVGIYTYERTKATITKPFLKFYDKSSEMKSNYGFFKLLPNEIKKELNENFVYRFEFTLKEKSFFDKYEISNRLEEVFEVTQCKWQAIGIEFLKYNFQPKINAPRDSSKLTPNEKTLSLSFLKDINRGDTIYQIRALYVRPDDDKQTRHRMKCLFEKIYHYCCVQTEKTTQLMTSYDNIYHWDKYFGLI